MIPAETLRELVQLRNRVSDLEAELAGLRSCAPDQELALRQNLGLPIGLTRMLLALSKGGILSREQLLYCGCDNPDGEPRLVDSMVMRIRRRLPWITIEAHYGYGYELQGEGLRRVREAMKSKETRQ